MAETIKLTPEELLAQSAEMSSIKSEFETLFSQVTSSLNSMNSSWSETLASNFSSKITAAQKSFSSVADMMGNGAIAARVSASTFSEPGAVLSALSTALGSANEMSSNSSDDSDSLTKTIIGTVWKHTMHAQEDPDLREKADTAIEKASDAFKSGDIIEGIKESGKAYYNECLIGLNKMGQALEGVYTDLYQYATGDDYDPLYGVSTSGSVVDGVSVITDTISNVANKYSGLTE